MRHEDVAALASQWDREVPAAGSGEVSVILRTLKGPVASRRAGSAHYAASTIKLPVAVAALAEIEAGRMRVHQQIEVRDTFPSATGGLFSMRQLDDQDDATWSRLGSGLELGVLIERMIVESSNIATNLIVTEIGFNQVRRVAARVSSEEIVMGRLIGDERAEGNGVTNTVTARGLSRLLADLAAGSLLPPGATQRMLDLMARQRHRHMIPAGLPPGTWSASKGGWKGPVNHDVALIRPESAPPYILAVCTTTALESAAARLIARLAAITWEHWSRWHVSSKSQ